LFFFFFFFSISKNEKNIFLIVFNFEEKINENISSYADYKRHGE